MIISNKTVALLLALANIINVQAMEQAQAQPATATAAKAVFGIYAHNTTSRTINLFWVDKRGNQKTKLIEAGKKELISKYADLQVHYGLKFAPYGSVLGYSAVPVEAPFNDLASKWTESKQNANDNLLITITTSSMIYLDLQYSSIVAENATSRAGMPADKALELFPRLCKYAAVLESLTPDKVISFERFDQEVVPASSWLSRATTAEDVYRYILGLPTNYTKAMVNDSYRKLATEFHPDKLTENTALANAALVLLKKASQGLLDALEAKRGSGDWIVVGEDK